MYINMCRLASELIGCGTDSRGLLLIGVTHGRIKGFVGHRNFSSLGLFGDSKTVGTTVYSRLSGLMEGMQG
jgi:hypothetical protein